MTHEDLHNLIYQAGHRHGPDLLFTRPIHHYVEIGELYYYDYLEKERNPFRGPCKVYFVLSSAYQYVGVVLDMDIDLHVYTLPEYRGKGFMRTALSKVILPHLFSSKRLRSISITIDKYESSPESTILAKKLGFKRKKVDGNKTIYSRGSKGLQYFAEEIFPIQLGISRTLELKSEVETITKRLRQIYSETKIGLGNGFDKKIHKEFTGTLDKISRLGRKIDDRRRICEEEEKKYNIPERWSTYKSNLVDEEE